MPDLVYSAIEEALQQHGLDLADGRRMIQWTSVVPIFQAKRPNHRRDLNRDQVMLGLKALEKEGAIARDEALIWLT